MADKWQRPKKVVRARAKEARRSTVRLASETAPSTGGPDINGLAICIDDSRDAALDGDTGPAEPVDFNQLRGRLEASKAKFPPLYRDEFVDPYIATLDQLGVTGFAQVLVSDPGRERTAGLMLDMAHAILQRGEQFQIKATDAFEEVVGDLYDGFLSAEDRRGVKPPDREATAPLGKWGNPDFGPYTWPVDATSTFGGSVAVVNLPPANARRGLLAWSALAHEAAGHDILHADDGLQDELASTIRTALAATPFLAGYWADRIDETASDVLGILNMGPAAAIGLVGYFRGLNKAFSGQAVLRSAGPAGDPHPADILRGYLGAEVVALLEFGQSADWAGIIAAETDHDVGPIVLAGRPTSLADARQSARLVAHAIVMTRLETLEHHALGEIQNWRDADEEKVAVARKALTTATDLPKGSDPIYAAHLVAAAVTEALSDGSNIGVLFNRMINLLAKMHAENPVWGSLFVRHPGDIARDLAYLPSRAA